MTSHTLQTTSTTFFEAGSALVLAMAEAGKYKAAEELLAQYDPDVSEVSDHHYFGVRAKPCSTYGSVIRTLWWTCVDVPLIPRGSHCWKKNGGRRYRHVTLLAVWFILLFTVHVSAQQTVLVDDFARADSLYHGDGWETVNPGCWKIENHALRRRLRNRGDWGSSLEFPFRALLDGPKPAVAKLPLPRPYGPALPVAMIWKRDWKLQGNYTIRIDATVRALPPVIEERKNDPDYAPAYSLMGIGFGSRSLLESWSVGKAKTAAWMALWRGDGRFGIYSHATDRPETAAERSEKTSLSLQPGETTMYYTVWKDGSDVTPDPRTGWLGKKDYVGRLPQLSAPYRLCGLGGHAITGPANMPETYKFAANWVRGQPTPEAYQHFEQYDFQILNWEDDVLFSTIDGRPIRGTRSLADGSVPLRGLVEIDGEDIIPGTHLRMTAFDGKNLDARIIETKPVDRNILRAFRANIERLAQQAEAEYQGWIQDYQKSKGTKQ